MEIITGVERRRRWRAEDKLRVLAEAAQPGARTSEVARRHDISRGLLWYWRRQLRQLRQGRLTAAHAPEPVFLPLQVSDAVPPGPVVPAAGVDPRIEIALPDGTLVRVGADVDAAALRRVLSVLRR
ncbi:IS66-like element accessory protein TnpA [Muricoccus aerilatus]|uniref:IS66-like element accessory protein TnpA n=1 Tax=Muricoccus aerilatus TaxID=452982 RepID=UPI0005C1B46F|nr:transposase [Roseomonas aerilata]